VKYGSFSAGSADVVVTGADGIRSAATSGPT